MKKYFFDQDNSSHWYLVDFDHKQEWQEWLQLDEDDEAAWDEPEFSWRLPGGPQDISFIGPLPFPD